MRMTTRPRANALWIGRMLIVPRSETVRQRSLGPIYSKSCALRCVHDAVLETSLGTKGLSKCTAAVYTAQWRYRDLVPSHPPREADYLQRLLGIYFRNPLTTSHPIHSQKAMLAKRQASDHLPHFPICSEHSSLMIQRQKNSRLTTVYPDTILATDFSTNPSAASVVDAHSRRGLDC